MENTYINKNHENKSNRFYKNEKRNCNAPENEICGKHSQISNWLFSEMFVCSELSNKNHQCNHPQMR